MRQTILAALTMTTLSLAACGGEEPAPQAPPAPAPTTPVAQTPAPPPADTTPPPAPKPSLADLIPQTMKGIGDAFNAHDAQKMANYFTDDASVFSYGEGEMHSKADLAKGMADMFAMIGDAKSTPNRLWVKGNIVVVEMAWAGTMTGDFMGMKATHKPVGQMRAHVYWFNDDGLVKEMHEYADDAGLMAQMQNKKGAPPVPTLATNPPELHIAKGTPDEDKLADWAKAGDDAFNKDDAKAVAAGSADDADYWLNFTGMPATKGRKDMTKQLTSWFKTFPDQKWTPVNTWGIDGFAIIEHTMSGTQKGALGPMPASNKAVSNWHWLDIMQPTADGKLQHGWAYGNLVEMMKQTGAMKEPGEKPVAGKGNGKPGASKP